MKYCVYLIPNVGIGIIPSDVVSIFKNMIPQSKCVFTGTYKQCMFYVRFPISLN